MSTKVLIINDNALTLGDASGVLVSSPGYAVVVDKQTQFGDSAASLNRIHPVDASNDFWHRLSMDPLSRPLASYRHTADIAHAHLMSIAEEADAGGEVILAVPGSFSRQQLAILLGLIRQTPFQAVALVDSALLHALAARQRLSTGNLLVADQHLHQTVLTQCRDTGSELVCETVAQVPGGGWSSCADHIVQLLTDAFIQQSRFNPQHSARWEQYLYDVVPGWLEQGADADNLLHLEIATESATHQARVTRSTLENSLQSIYRTIYQHLPEVQQGTGLLLSERIALLPGIRQSLGAAGLADARTVETAELVAVALDHSDRLRQTEQTLQFTRRLAVKAVTGSVAADTASIPTHALVAHQAWPLAAGLELALEQQESGEQLSIRKTNGQATSGVLGQLAKNGQGITLQAPASGLLLNGQPVNSPCTLETGDSLSYPGVSQHIQLIQVRDGTH